MPETGETENAPGADESVVPAGHGRAARSVSDAAAAHDEGRIRAILAKPYWDYEEASLVLHISVKTLRNMKYRREITFTHFGGKVYFPRPTILTELRRNTVCGSAHARQDGRRAAA